MNTTTNTLVQKLWNYCNVLRDDGMSYGDYVEQLTYLLFLKMAENQAQRALFLPQLFQRVAVVVKQRVAVHRQQGGPGVG